MFIMLALSLLQFVSSITINLSVIIVTQNEDSRVSKILKAAVDECK